MFKKYSLNSCLAVFIFFVHTATAQDTDRFSELSIGLGTGYPGLLMLDELIDGTDFNLDRKASPPLHLLIETNVSQQFDLGIYLGYEFESQSGTIEGFPGNNTLFIAGITVNWMLTLPKNNNAFRPLIGAILSYSRIDFNTPLRGLVPQIRLGVEKNISEKLFSQLRIGYGAAIVELSILRRFTFNKP